MKTKLQKLTIIIVKFDDSMHLQAPLCVQHRKVKYKRPRKLKCLQSINGFVVKAALYQ